MTTCTVCGEGVLLEYPKNSNGFCVPWVLLIAEPAITLLLEIEQEHVIVGADVAHRLGPLQIEPESTSGRQGDVVAVVGSAGRVEVMAAANRLDRSDTRWAPHLSERRRFVRRDVASADDRRSSFRRPRSTGRLLRSRRSTAFAIGPSWKNGSSRYDASSTMTDA